MSINEDIKKIILQHRLAVYGHAPMAFDGVVDEGAYLSAPIKTAFLLKEVNGEEKKKQDGQTVVIQMEKDWEFITDFMQTQATDASCELYPTWHNVCMWIEVLLNPTVTYAECMNQWGHFDAARLRSNLGKIAVVNIKKSPGGAGSDYKEIEYYAQHTENASLLREQMAKIQPDLVICGGTFAFAHKIWGDGSPMVSLSSGARCFTCGNMVFLEFVHPRWFSVNRNILFAYAKEVFSDVRPMLLSE